MVFESGRPFCRGAELMLVQVDCTRTSKAADFFLRSVWLIACVVIIACQPSSARAQTVDDQQQLFQRMMLNPADHENTFAFVKVATERGDYEAAIGALERLLFYNPALTRVKYELGALYFRLGSYEMARRYFNEALARPD